MATDEDEYVDDLVRYYKSNGDYEYNKYDIKNYNRTCTKESMEKQMIADKSKFKKIMSQDFRQVLLNIFSKDSIMGCDKYCFFNMNHDNKFNFIRSKYKCTNCNNFMRLYSSKYDCFKLENHVKLELKKSKIKSGYELVEYQNLDLCFLDDILVELLISWYIEIIIKNYSLHQNIFYNFICKDSYYLFSKKYNLNPITTVLADYDLLKEQILGIWTQLLKFFTKLLNHNYVHTNYSEEEYNLSTLYLYQDRHIKFDDISYKKIMILVNKNSIIEYTNNDHTSKILNLDNRINYLYRQDYDINYIKSDLKLTNEILQEINIGKTVFKNINIYMFIISLLKYKNFRELSLNNKQINKMLDKIFYPEDLKYISDNSETKKLTELVFNIKMKNTINF